MRDVARDGSHAARPWTAEAILVNYHGSAVILALAQPAGDTSLKDFFNKLSTILTSTRTWIVNLFTLALLVYFVVMAVIVLRKLPQSVDPDGRVLIIAPEGLIQEQRVLPSPEAIPFALGAMPQIQSRDLVRVIRAARDDNRLAGVLLDFSKAEFSGPSTALRIAGELAALRGSGKPVIAYSETLGTAGYMLAAQADQVYVHPSGAVAISGLGGYRDYYRELAGKLKITIHNYSQGDFKSASERLTRDSMSDADRLQQRELYTPIWQALKSQSAEARGIEPQLLQTLADEHPMVLVREAGYDNLAFARAKGLIDGTMSFPEFRAFMIEKFGKAEDDERDTYPHIGSDAYLAQLPAEAEAPDAVAVVFVEGVIQRGDVAPGVAGSDDVARLLRRAHEDKRTRAIVLRVNSPGGSIIASDIIRDELVAARVKGLPVVVSMGDVAASGGVWISTPADVIYAEPTTITGSIGVAVAFPTLENLFDHAGIHFDGVRTSEYAGWSLNRPIDEELDAIFARWASSAYTRFISLVAESRSREPEYIRSIAGGRIWIGSRALELGLVDALGSLEEAIADAAARAALEEYQVDYVTRKPSPLMALLQRLSGGLAVADSSYGSFARRVSRLMSLVDNIDRPTATVMCKDCMVEVL